jgi:hypothetical protein
MKVTCIVTGKEVSVNLPQLIHTAGVFGVDLETLKQNYVGRSGRDVLRTMTRDEVTREFPTLPNGFLKYCGTAKRVAVAQVQG